MSKAGLFRLFFTWEDGNHVIILMIFTGSSDEFAESVAHYDRITRLDEWLTSMLLRIKNLISRGLCCIHTLWDILTNAYTNATQN